MKRAALSLLLALAPSAFAASTVELRVTGVITPSACTPTLSQDGLVDFGRLAAKDLSVDSITHLPTVIVQLRVSCTAPALFALRGLDNRAGTAYYYDGYEYGLGVVNGDPAQKLGFYELTLENPLSDVGPQRILMSMDSGESWWDFGSDYYWLTNHQWVAFGNSQGGAAAPVAMQQLTADLKVSTRLAPTRGLDLTEQAPLDGSATVELLYL